jgi:hypothetical protein
LAPYRGSLPRSGASVQKAYLTSAQAYALISSPTAISMMTGVFHFIAISLDLLFTIAR